LSKTEEGQGRRKKEKERKKMEGRKGWNAASNAALAVDSPRLPLPES
jgi:hypothetical protein